MRVILFRGLYRAGGNMALAICTQFINLQKISLLAGMGVKTSQTGPVVGDSDTAQPSSMRGGAREEMFAGSCCALCLPVFVS